MARKRIPIQKRIGKKIPPRQFHIKSYDEGWEGLNKLITDLSEYVNSCLKFAKANNVKDWGRYINYKMDDETKINPSFYPFISHFLHAKGYSREIKGKWLNLDKFLDDKDNFEFQDFLGANYSNVNSIFPNYENKGTVVIYRIDSEEGFEEGNTKKVGDVFSYKEWSKDVANVLNTVDKFSEDIKLTPIQIRGIKYILGEVIANTFQHAFKDEGSSSIGIYIDKKTMTAYLTISDRGLSIPGSFRKRYPKFKNKSDSFIIEYALGEGNTSKDESKQGGMGLFRVKNIIAGSDSMFAIRSLYGIVVYNDNEIEKSKNYYSNIGTAFFAKINLNKIREEDLRINESNYIEIKEMFK